MLEAGELYFNFISLWYNKLVFVFVLYNNKLISLKKILKYLYLLLNLFYMSVNLYSTPKYIQVYAVCVDAKKPKFETDEWVEHGKMYKVKHFTEPLNVTEGQAVTITDKDQLQV
jgi:hypothetical protein